MEVKVTANLYLEETTKERNVVCPLFKGGIKQRQDSFHDRGISSICFVRFDETYWVSSEESRFSPCAKRLTFDVVQYLLPGSNG